jgi:anti-repressor protein
MQLIKISDNKTVNARELHAWLGVETKFTTWFDRMCEYGFEVQKDFFPFLGESNGGRPSTEIAITIDMAKEISMLQRTEKGKEARLYFIEIEKKALKPISIEEMIIAQAQSVIEAKNRIETLEEKVKLIEAKNTTSSMDYFTIAGYWTLNNKQIDVKTAASIGKKASSICNQMGYVTGTLPDPRFGRVKTYPIDVLKEVFEKNL